MGPVFLAINRSRRSVALDLKAPAGLDAMRRLLATDDVLMHNLRPASIEGLGLGYGSVDAVRPGIVWCGMYGYGEGGPYAGRPTTI